MKSMVRAKTHFEQVPVSFAKKIAEQEIPSSQMLSVSCAICGTPVALDLCKTDEGGEAVHGECYMTKVAFSKTAGARVRAQS